METINEYVRIFAEYSKEYPIVAGGFGIWALGILTYFFKWIPKKVWQVVARNLTTSLTLVNTHESYHKFLKWYEENNFSHNSRSIKISNGAWGYSDMVKAMGYGTHYFIFNRTPIRLVLTQKDAVGSSRERDEVKMTILGRSHRVFDIIFDAIKDNEDNSKLTIMKYKDGWSMASIQRKRPLNTIFLNKDVKTQIINFVESFKKREQFHLDNGINHQTGIMLYGPPGTGKTSIAKAIASHLDMKIFNLDVSSLSKIQDSFAALPENALVTIEDIDGSGAVHDREIKKDNSKDDLSMFMYPLGISEVLNSIDGIHCSHGRILIATTNHFDKLDKALLRNGRFDLKIKIDYADDFTFNNFAKRFFNKEIPVGIKIKDNIPSCDLQSFAIQNNYEKFIEEFREC